jgi:GH24 family phage-related lysozyme (muramidase)
VVDYSSRMKAFEGYTPRAAWDYKQHTNGYGTRARYPGEVIDREEAERRFQDEKAKAGAFVDSLGVQMTPGQKAALEDLTFNAGTEWAGSGLGKAVKSGDWDTAADRFTLYNKAGGKTLPGLVTRRAEGASWIRGSEPSGGTEVAMADPGVMGPPAASPPQGAFAALGHKAQQGFASSPLGTLASGLQRGDSTDIAAGAGGAFSGIGKALSGGGGGAFSGFGGGQPDAEASKNLAEMQNSANQANAQALSTDEQRQAQALQAMMARRQQPRGAFA